MSAYSIETVQSVQHWTDTLFSFTTSRSAALRFDCGQFVMIGLEHDGKPLTRAYSLVSTNYDDHLEFLSIKVPDGPLTSKLQHIAPGDSILVSKKPVGTLVIDNLKPGRILYLLGTGTGLAPFMSIIRDPATYERFEKVLLVHGCRLVSELAYGDRIMRELPEDDFIGDLIREKLVYFPTVTREPFKVRGRISDLMESGQLYAEARVPEISSEHDRVMLCGSPDMLRDLRAFVEARGFHEGNSGRPAEFVIEKAFVEK